MDVLDETSASWFRERFARIRDEVSLEIVGQREVVEGVLVALLAGGHVLLEGLPGLGKTLLVRTLAKVFDVHFQRIQFTPDLMPADIIGTNIVVEDPVTGRRRFEFHAGPLFAQLVLADEVNRATPKTQSALLEAMQESRVTVAGEGRELGAPFFVLATQNPIELEGTYPLPEAQLDRFLFQLLVDTPALPDLVEILDRTTGAERPGATSVVTADECRRMQGLVRQVPAPRHVLEWVARLVRATHPGAPEAAPSARRFLRYGSSIRGGQAIALASKVAALAAGRLNVAFEDVRRVCRPALRHRLIRNFEADAEGVTTDRVIDDVLAAVPELSVRNERLIGT